MRSFIGRFVLVASLMCAAVASGAGSAEARLETIPVPAAVGRSVLAVAPNGEIYTSGDGLNRVYRVAADGAALGSFGGAGLGQGKFGVPSGLEVDSSGHVFVADLNYASLPGQEFTASGDFVRSFGTASQRQRRDVALTPSQVLLLTTDGLLDTYSAAGASMGLMSISRPGVPSPWPMTMDTSPVSGDIYILSSYGHEIWQYDSSAAVFIRSWAVEAPDGVSLRGIAVGPDGTVYALGGPGVIRFSSTGVELGRYSVPGGIEAIEDIDVRGSKLYVLYNSSVDRVDIGVPLVSLAASPSAPAPGSEVTLTASASVPFGSVTKYEWDLDGDGSFEVDSGSVNSSKASFASAGSFNVGVRVTAASGETETSTSTVEVRSPSQGAPPGGTGPVGVSINDGAQFTNDPQVTLKVSWPSGSSSVLLSNDGGFGRADRRPVARTIPWTLSSSGPERLPKTVYVRFDGSDQNFTDDIILDETAPTISSASLAGASASAAAKAKTYQVRVKASDKTSGVALAQVASSKKKPLAAQKYAARLKVKATSRPGWIRVRDQAGNWSRWKKLK